MAPVRNKLSKIDHFVVLMLENRSFDQMLGFLYTDAGNVSPLGHPYEGLTGKESNPDGRGKQVKVFKIDKKDPNAYYMPGADPGEGYYNTNDQLYGNNKPPAPGAKPTNKGFITNFAYTLGWQKKENKTSKNKKDNWSILKGTKATDIMGMFTPEMLPVLSTLAKSYAVCDHWYCSVPTETLPNRAFLAMATSQGRVNDAHNPYTATTIFKALENKKKTWAIYGYDSPPLSRGSYTDITHAPNSNFGEYADFEKAVKNGRLAHYVFLEPHWKAGGNSQHPNYNVANGESFILQVYNTLRQSGLWDKTMLIVTYDEHGGNYDHVAPPANAVPPDDTIGESGFKFDRFGVRVPAVLISPYIQAGTVYRVPENSMPLDHTSILKTVEKRFGVAPLTRRDANAPDFGDVLTLSRARTDDPLAGVKAPKAGKQTKGTQAPDHLQQLYVGTMNSLPLEEAHRKGGVPRTDFKTSKEAMRYAGKRYHEYFKTRKR